MEMLERYLFQVGRFLNKKEKEDTINELKSIILDQLDERVQNGENEEDALSDIIKTLGDPRSVAYQYKNVKPLLSEGLEMIMWVIIKNIAIFVPLAIIIGKTVSFINTDQPFVIMDVFLMWAYSIPGILNAVIFSSGTVFFIFLMIERYGDTNIQLGEQYFFEPKTLPPLPKKVFHVSIFEMIIVIFGSILFLYILNLQPGLIGIHYEGTKIPLLNENFEYILPFININIMIQMGVAIYHLYKRRKNYVTKTIEFLSQIFGAVVLIYIFNNNIFDQRVFDDLGLNFLNSGFRIAILVIAIFGIIGAITQFVKMLLVRD